MRSGLDKRWLLPLGVLTVCALLALNVAVFGPYLADDSEGAARPLKVSDCTGVAAIDYACYEERYHELVRRSGVEAAFADLKQEHEKSGFVRVACHDLTHVIGHAAGSLHGDLSTAYSRGDPYCAGGYYHGVTGTIVVEMGADRILEEADAFCADLRENEEHSFRHYSCAHGLGHGFMVVYENELFDSLEACDALTDSWERDSCYGGVFIENVTATASPSRPSKYVRADQPLYPCTDVEARYQNQCYEKQAAYALHVRNDDYVAIFDLCAAATNGPRPACYQGLGASAAAHGIKYVTGEAARAESVRALCMQGEGYEARSNCVAGAVRNLIHYYNSTEQAEALCEALEEADLRAACRERTEDEDFA